MNYFWYIKSAEWKAVRRAKIDCDGEVDEAGRVQCERCFMFASRHRINVHHKTYEHLGNEPMHDLEILCDGCHKQEHFGEPPWWADADALPPSISEVAKEWVAHRIGEVPPGPVTNPF